MIPLLPSNVKSEPVFLEKDRVVIWMALPREKCYTSVTLHVPRSRPQTSVLPKFRGILNSMSAAKKLKSVIFPDRATQDENSISLT